MDTVRIRRIAPVLALVAVIVVLVVVGFVGYMMLFGSFGARTSTSGSGTTPSTGISVQPGLAAKQVTTPEAASTVSKSPSDFSSARSSSGEQLVVRTASMRLHVDDIDATLTKVRNAVAAFNGQIDDLQVSSETDIPIYYPEAQATGSSDTVPLSAYVTVRVPSARLAEFSRRVASFGKVLRESANQTDVTQQHIDLTARLANLRAEEVRLRGFLNDAKNVKEMLAVEQELSRVRGEIESMQSQLDYLDKQISYGTLTIELQKPAPVVRPTGTDWGFAQAITNGIRGAAGVVRSAITVLIALSPVILLVLIVWLVTLWWVRRRRRASVADGAQDASSTPPAGSDATTGAADADSSAAMRDAD